MTSNTITISDDEIKNAVYVLERVMKTLYPREQDDYLGAMEDARDMLYTRLTTATLDVYGSKLPDRKKLLTQKKITL
jgi:hypothetical protein